MTALAAEVALFWKDLAHLKRLKAELSDRSSSEVDALLVRVTAVTPGLLYNLRRDHDQLREICGLKAGGAKKTCSITFAEVR